MPCNNTKWYVFSVGFSPVKSCQNIIFWFIEYCDFQGGEDKSPFACNNKPENFNFKMKEVLAFLYIILPAWVKKFNLQSGHKNFQTNFCVVHKLTFSLLFVVRCKSLFSLCLCILIIGSEEIDVVVVIIIISSCSSWGGRSSVRRDIPLAAWKPAPSQPENKR